MEVVLSLGSVQVNGHALLVAEQGKVPGITFPGPLTRVPVGEADRPGRVFANILGMRVSDRGSGVGLPAMDVFDFDDLGAEVGQDLAGEGTGPDDGDIEGTDAGEGKVGVHR